MPPVQFTASAVRKCGWWVDGRAVSFLVPKLPQPAAQIKLAIAHHLPSCLAHKRKSAIKNPCWVLCNGEGNSRFTMTKLVFFLLGVCSAAILGYLIHTVEPVDGGFNFRVISHSKTTQAQQATRIQALEELVQAAQANATAWAANATRSAGELWTCEKRLDVVFSAGLWVTGIAGVIICGLLALLLPN